MASTYEYGPLVYQPADADDDADLKTLCRQNPMESWVRVSMEREPSFFAGDQLWSGSLPVIVRDRSRHAAAAGMWYAGVQPAFVNGREAQCAYLGGLRIAAEYRHKPRFLRAGFRSIRELWPASLGTPEFWFTSIADENAPAKRLLEGGIRGLPRYRPAGSLHTLAIAARQGARQNLLRPATTADLPALQGFYNRQSQNHQFAPPLSEAWLARLAGTLSVQNFLVLADGDEIHGCLALWDQRTFKQTVVQGYRFPLQYLRHPWNWLAYWRRTLPLPAAGRQLNSVFLAFFALDPAHAELAAAVIRDALSFAGDDVVAGLLGLSAVNPLRRQIVESLRPQIYGTTIYALDWPDLATTPIDDRPVQPEIAML